jgi:HlyD family secretion protein
MSQQSAATASEPPWSNKRTGKPKGVLRKLVSWSALLGLIALIASGLRTQPVEVELGELSPGPLTVHVIEEGKTRVRNRYVVSTPVAGQMGRVRLKAGDEVKAGDTVITVIEPALSPLLDPRAKAQAEARVQMASAARQQAEEALQMTKTAAQFAKTNWERVNRVESKGTVSETDRDNAERDAAMRTQEVRSSEFAAKVAAFELEQAKAALLQLQSPAKDGAVVEVRSPVSGRILKLLQESAMPVTPGTAIVEVGDPADIEVEAEILSRDAVTIKPGAPVSIEQWGGQQPLQGRVRLVEPAAFTKVSALGVEEQRVIVLSDFTDPPTAVKALGDRYRVEVKVAVWHADNVLLIPSGALFREGNFWKTFLFADGKAKRVTVEAGHSDGRMTEVLGGLKQGDVVLLHPPDTVKDGSAVKKRTDL